MKLHIIVGIVILALCMGCTSPHAQCQAQTKGYLAKARPIYDKFTDADTLAKSTARIALAPVIQQLQQIRREYAAVEVPKCAEAGATLIIDGMSDTIDGYLAFMGQKDDATVSASFERGIARMTVGLIQLRALQDGNAATPTPEWQSK